MPFEEREFHNPGKFPGIGPNQVFPPGKIQPKLPETHRRRVWRAGSQQQEVLGAGMHLPEERAKRSFRNRLHRADWRLTGSYPDQPREAHVFLRTIDEHVELTASHAVAAR